MDAKRPTPRHIIIKMLKVKDKGRMFFFKDFIYLFLDRRGREGEGEKHQCVVASHAPQTACHPGMCPD